MLKSLRNIGSSELLVFLQQGWMSMSPPIVGDGVGFCKATGHIRREVGD